MSRHYGGRGAPGAPPVGSGHYRGGEGDRLGSSRSGIRLGTEGRPGDFVSAEAQIQRWKSEFVVEIMDVLDEFRSQAVAPLAKQLQQLQHSVATLEEERGPAQRAVDAMGELERSMRASAEESRRELVNEQRDHAEAINNLISMLETTATRDDLATATGGVSDEVAQLREAVNDARAQLGLLEAELEERARGQAVVEEERRQAAATELESTLVEVSRELRRVEGLAEEGRERASSLADGAVAELQSAAEGLDRRCSELEDVVGSAAAAKARNEMVHTMNRTVLSLETKADSTSQVLHQKIELLAAEIDRQLETVGASLEAKLSQADRDTSAQFRTASTEMRSDFSAEKQALDTELQMVKEHITLQERRLQSTISDNLKVIQTRMDNEATVLKSTMEERLVQMGSKVDRRLDSALDSLSQANGRVDELGSRVGQLNQEVSDKLADSSTRFDSVRQETSDQLQELKQSLKNDVNLVESALSVEMKLVKDAAAESAKRLESKLDADTRRMSTRQDAQQSEVGNTCTEIRRELVSKCRGLESEAAKQQAQCVEQVRTVESRLTDKESSLRIIIEELKETVSAKHRAMDTAQANVETEVTNRLRNQETQLDSTRTQLTELCSRLDARVSEQKQSASEQMRDKSQELSDKILEVRSMVNERCSQMDKTIEKDTKTFQDKLSQQVTEEHVRIDELSTDLKACAQQCDRVEASLEFASEASVEVKDQLLELGATTERKALERSTKCEALVDDLKGKLNQTVAQFTTQIGGFEAKQTGMGAKLQAAVQTVADHREKFTAWSQRLENEQRTDHRTCVDSLSNVKTLITEVRGELEAKIQAHYQHFTDTSLNLDHRVKQAHAAAEVRTNDQHQHVMDMLATIELQSKQKDTEHDSRFADVHATLMAKSADFNDTTLRIEKQAKERESRSVELISEMAKQIATAKRELIDLCGVVEKKGVETSRVLEDQVANQVDGLSQLVSKVQNSVDNLERQQSERCNGLQTTFEEGLQRSDAALATMNNELIGKMDDINSSVRKNFEHSCADIERQHMQAIGACNSLDKKFATRTTMLHEKLGSLTEQVATNREQATDALVDLDSKYSERCQIVEERLSSSSSMVTELVRQLETSLRQKDDALDEAVRGQHAHFTSAVAEVEQLCLRNTAAVEDKQALTDDTVAANHDNLTKVCEQLVDMVKTENRLQDNRFQAEVDRLETRVRSGEASLDQRSSELLDADDRLQSQLDAVIAEAHRKTVKLESADASLSLELDRRASKIEGDLAAANLKTVSLHEEQSVRVEQLESDVSGNLSTAVADLQAHIEKDLRPLMVDVTQLQSESASTAAVATRADTVSSSTSTRLFLLTNDVEETKQAIQSVDATMAESSKEIGELEAQVVQLQADTGDLAVEVAMHESAMVAGAP